MARGLNTQLRSARSWLFAPVLWTMLPSVHAHEQNSIEHNILQKADGSPKQLVLQRQFIDAKLMDAAAPNNVMLQSKSSQLPTMTEQASKPIQWAAARTLRIDDEEASAQTDQEPPTSLKSEPGKAAGSSRVSAVASDVANVTLNKENQATPIHESEREIASKATEQMLTEDTSSTINENANDETAANSEEEEIDPSERINRAVFSGNEVLDKGLIKPVAKTYKSWIPAGIRRCFSNMLENIGMPYTAVNNVLQGKIKSAGQDVGRVLINSTIGLGGCFDVASDLGIPKHDEDFGQTLGVWGVPTGRYIMLPFFGPSNVRDALSKPIDLLANPLGYITKIRLRNSLNAFKVVDTRANLLELTDILDENSLDKYTMLRDSWMERRQAQVDDTDGSYDSNVMTRLEPKIVTESDIINAKPLKPGSKDDVQKEAAGRVLDSQNFEAAQMTPAKPRVVNINQ